MTDNHKPACYVPDPHGCKRFYGQDVMCVDCPHASKEISTKSQPQLGAAGS